MIDNGGHEALVQAYQRQLASLLTEPLTVQQIADEFQIGRNKAAVMLKHMPGIERVGKRVRVPLFKMPPAYIAALGFAPFCTTDADRQ